MSFTMPAQNTSNITEGSNLYYTNARADARIVNAGSANWNTAYGWGNHASAGYSTTDTTYSVQDGELSQNNFTNADHSKLDGIAASANNYSHPSNHAISVITGLQTALDGKVDDSQVLTNVPSGAVFTDTNTTYSVGDGGLSQNNFTNADHSKLDGIATGATNTAAPHYTSAIAVGAGGLTQQNFTTTLKNKLDGIAASANNYVLPFTNNSSNWNTAYGWGDHASAGYTNDQTPAEILTALKTVDVNGTAGVNAGTFDGLQATSFLRSDAADSGGTTTGSSLNIPYLKTNMLLVGATNFADTINGAPWYGLGKSTLVGYHSNNSTMSQLANYWGLRLQTATARMDMTPTGYTGNILFGAGTDVSGTTWARINSTGLYQGLSNLVWHAGNDGAGSGLDADLLDGQQGSYYRAYANLTGTPTIPSLSGYATESYVGTQISNLVDSSPAALNTLNELAAALGDNASFATDVTTSIGLKSPIASPTFTGTLIAPQIKVGDGTDGVFYSDQAGRTAFNSGDFYIQTGVTNYYNYATNQYHGNSSGDNHYFRGNPLSGNSWSITAAGVITAAGGNSGNWNTAYTVANAALPKAGGTLTGTLTTAGNIVVPANTGLQTSGTETKFTTAHGYIQLGPMNTSYAHIYTNIAGGFYFNKNNLYANGNTMWTVGNDGSGSGLDADTLDGYQKADLNPAHSHYRWTNISASGTQARRFVIMRLYACPAHWDSNWQDIHLKVWSESYEATNLKYELCGDYNGGNQNTMFQLRLKDAGGSSEHGRFRLVLGTPVDAGWDHSGQNTYYVDVYAEASHYMNFTVAADFYSAGFNVNTLPTSGGATSVVYSSPAVSNITTFAEDKEHSYFANHKIWNAGNHGSASGLDADLLDGQHGSYYAPASHVHSYLPLAGGTLTGTLTSRDIMIGSGYNLQRSTHQSGHFEGGHNNIGSTATKTSPIYTIGSSYNPAESTLSNMYGIGFSHINASFINVTGGSGWGMYVASDGDARIFLDAENGTVHTTGAYRVGSNIVWHAG